MADALLATRSQTPPKPTGKNWATRVTNTQPELQMNWSKQFHSQRAKNEDPAAIQAWFQRVQEARQTYGILDEDVYSFDETGFIIGVAGTIIVATSSDTASQAVAAQPDNHEWATTIEGINASGRAIPPFIILPKRLHQASWYHDLPPDWVVGVSDNGWTTDLLGFEWLKHFNKHASSYTSGAYRLLILNGHSSHATPDFDQYCTEHKIITLCMPEHTSHLLQPLDVGCFSPLKQAYGCQVQELLARQGFFYIAEEEFLSIYLAIRKTVFTEKNIKASFQAAGLVPYSPERVLQSLTLVRTPSSPETAAGLVPYSPEPVLQSLTLVRTPSLGTAAMWTAETPNIIDQLQKQAQLLRNLLQPQSQSPSTPNIQKLVKACLTGIHSAIILAEEDIRLRATNERQSQSPSTLAIQKFVKGCMRAMHSAIVLAEENIRLRATIERRKQKQAKRRQYIASRGALQAQEGQLLAAEAERVVQEGDLASAKRRQRAPPTCSNCHEQGHSRTQCTAR